MKASKDKTITFSLLFTAISIILSGIFSMIWLDNFSVTSIIQFYHGISFYCIYFLQLLFNWGNIIFTGAIVYVIIFRLKKSSQEIQS